MRTAPVITSTDRLVLTLFLAVAFHALLILGVSFTFLSKPKSQKLNTLDITLVNTRTDVAPKNPDYLAQESQQGGGTTKQRVHKKIPKTAPTPSPTAGKAPVTAPAAAPAKPNTAPAPVLTREKSPQKVATATPKPKVQPKPRPSAAQLMRSSMQEIARLEARTQNSWEVYSKRPNRKYLYANTRRTVDAEYLHYWTKKVEQIGNLNYPDKARRAGLSGSLIMEVTERPDGSVVSIRILESSGHKVLDDAAVRIVRLAAPFAPVPPSVLQGKNELRIVRTWLFTSGNQLQSR
jgi:protein TonB